MILALIKRDSASDARRGKCADCASGMECTSDMRSIGVNVEANLTRNAVFHTPDSSVCGDAVLEAAKRKPQPCVDRA